MQSKLNSKIMGETRKNSKKVSFISCVNNYKEYKRALHYIHSLKIPNGIEIETVAMNNAKSLTSGYNEKMELSDAKYKVYLHQDAYILNTNFLFEVIHVLEKYPDLGILGVIGAKTLPSNGVWWSSSDIYGSVYQTPRGKGKIDLLSLRNVINDYEQVRVIDGLIMITQYDLPWREDLFKGWHFYDVSQCLEFAKAGYKVGVIKQKSPWCLHDCGKVNISGYEENRKIFVQNYSDYIF